MSTHAVDDTAPTDNLHNQAQGALRAFVERIERLEEEKTALAEDIREIYAEAKSSGFDSKALREIIRIRKLPEHERQEREGLLATYMHALDMIPALRS
jgi:uncharacterized protein (UPF0335 family)